MRLGDIPLSELKDSHLTSAMENGDDINMIMYSAATLGNLDICKSLIGSIDDINMVLSHAAWGGQLEICKYLVSQGASEFNLALSGAAKSGNLALCKYLVNMGADMYDLPLMGAVEGDHLELCEYFVNKGAGQNKDYLTFQLKSASLRTLKCIILNCPIEGNIELNKVKTKFFIQTTGDIGHLKINNTIF